MSLRSSETWSPGCIGSRSTLHKLGQQLTSRESSAAPHVAEVRCCAADASSNVKEVRCGMTRPVGNTCDQASVGNTVSAKCRDTTALQVERVVEGPSSGSGSFLSYGTSALQDSSTALDSGVSKMSQDSDNCVSFVQPCKTPAWPSAAAPNCT